MERSPPLFRTVYPNRNHVTTHPVLTLSTDSVTIFLAAKIGPEFGNKLYGCYPEAFDRGKCGLENGV